ncbi:MAG: glycosyltransferase family 4 protein [Anaerolineaceae bacterium]|jgi:glycosyltransferase involved in cell wall biosynthesis|nr:glycosyltransferase family 4 protein [Anaerolineaceae bacterium]
MKPQICLVPKIKGMGGTASFQAKFIQGLEARQISYGFDLNDRDNTAVLVIGGTRQVFQLWRAKTRGARIVQRLNGLNWLHKIEKTPWRAALRAERNNRLLAFIRRRLADRIVYQSNFSRDWWTDVFGPRAIPSTIVYNGIDLERYHPDGPESPPDDHDRILLVEGRLTGAYARGLETAVRLAKAVQEGQDRRVELMVVGDVSETIRTHAQALAPELWITWQGIVPRENIPAIDRSAHVLFSADLNAACPNSVIEALACGLPVIAYDTGALAELVRDGAGEIVPWGADYWHLADPVIPPLAAACTQILRDNTAYRKNARRRADAIFSLDEMVKAYLEALVGE